jgi:23S rRNA (uracil1939-C5)-methyltransferase
MAKPARGEELELSIDDLAFGGAGVGRHDGLVAFVPHTAPGDRVRARVRRSRRRHVDAELVEVLAGGPDRIAPECPLVPRCGGCKLQHLEYAVQLEAKGRQVAEHLRRIGGIEDPPVLPPDPAVATFGYRNKMEYSAAPGAGGAPRIGFHRAGRWDEIVDVGRCLIAGPRVDAVRETVREWAVEHGVGARDPATGEGAGLRHLVAREGVNTGQLLVTVVTTPGLEDPVDALADRLWGAHEGTVGLLHSVSDGVAQTTAGLPTRLVRGRDWFEERVGAVTLRLSASAFFQTNTTMTEHLYARAKEAAGLDGSQVVYDLYSGVGSIGVVLAEGAEQVVAVELAPEAAVDAEENARRNGVANHVSVCGDVGRALRRLRGSLPAPDVAIVDPPRAGLSGRAVRRILELAPPVLVYISCQPATFAENAARLVGGGYRLEWVRPVDMFPQTPHIEAVARFVR